MCEDACGFNDEPDSRGSTCVLDCITCALPLAFPLSGGSSIKDLSLLPLEDGEMPRSPLYSTMPQERSCRGPSSDATPLVSASLDTVAAAVVVVAVAPVEVLFPTLVGSPISGVEVRLRDEADKGGSSVKVAVFNVGPPANERLLRRDEGVVALPVASGAAAVAPAEPRRAGDTAFASSPFAAAAAAAAAAIAITRGTAVDCRGATTCMARSGGDAAGGVAQLCRFTSVM